MTNKLIGNRPNQIPTNADLGSMAYQDSDNVSVKNIHADSITGNLKLYDRTRRVFPNGTVRGMWVYDTTKDSDGGAWRSRTNHLSWYNEELDTAHRGSRKDFPAKVGIVTANDGVESRVVIYDLDNETCPVWMQFEAAAGNAFDGIEASDRYLFSCWAGNGILAVGAGRSSATAQGLYIIDFLDDQIYLIRGSDAGATHFNRYKSGIADRNVVYNAGSAYWGVNNDLSLSANPNEVFSITGFVPDWASERCGLKYPQMFIAHHNAIDVFSPTGNGLLHSATPWRKTAINPENNSSYNDIRKFPHVASSPDKDLLIATYQSSSAHGVKTGSFGDIIYFRNDYIPNEDVATNYHRLQGSTSLTWEGTINTNYVNGSGTQDGWVIPTDSGNDWAGIGVGRDNVYVGHNHGLTQLNKHNWRINARTTNHSTSGWVAGTNVFSFAQSNADAENGVGDATSFGGGANKFANPYFDGSNNWGVNNSGSLSTTSSAGGGSVTYTYGILTSTSYAGVYQDMAFEQNQTYVVYCTFNGGTDYTNVDIRIKDTTGGTGTTVATISRTSIPSGTWVTLAGEFTWNLASGNGSVILIPGRGGVASGTSYMTGFYMVKKLNETDDANLIPFNNVYASDGGGRNHKTVAVVGTLDRKPVAPGAELMAYYGFNDGDTQNFIEVPYADTSKRTGISRDGRGARYAKVWFRITSTELGGGFRNIMSAFDGMAAYSKGWWIFMNSSGHPYVYQHHSNNTGNGQSIAAQQNCADGEWHCVSVVWMAGGCSIYLDGRLYGSMEYGYTDYDQDNLSCTLRIGRPQHGQDSYAFTGDIALPHVSVGYAPSDEEVLEMYRSERALFQPNAKFALAGTYLATNALGHDYYTGKTYVSTPDGYSIMNGLVREYGETDSNSPSAWNIEAIDGVVLRD